MKSIQLCEYSGLNYAKNKSTLDLYLAFFLFFVLLASSGSTYADPIRTGFSGNTLAPNDDSSTGLVDLGFPINFFGNTFSQGFVNNNGNMTFDSALSTFTPFGLSNADRVIIAPFFADVDTEVSGSSPVTYGQGTVGSRLAFAINWVNVGCFSTPDGGFNSFQMVIIDRADIGLGDFDIEFNYQAIDWESGTASDGNEICEGGAPARIGYSNGTTTSFELDGSGVVGAFLDTNLDTGLIHNSRNSLESGRYLFEVRNGVAPTGNQISGTIFGNDTDHPLPAALVQVCTTDQDIQCNLTRSNSLGQYQVDALNQVTYEVRAFPPADTDFLPTTIGPISLVGVDLNNQDIILPEPQPLPSGTTISPSRTNGEAGEPVVYWGDPLNLSTQACSGGVGNFTLTLEDGTALTSGEMQENPANSEIYTATIPPLTPRFGHAMVAIAVNCPNGATEDVVFSIYIDPSGVVQDTFGNPVSGATVTLYRSDSSAGPFEQVANGSDIMSPSNRTNPDQSTAQGLFGWDVISGFYTVRATATGCTAPNTELDYVETEVLTIPPPVTDLELVLDCGSIFEPNTAPVSQDDAPAPVDFGQSTVIDVLINDSDSDGSLELDSVTIVTPPSSGVAQVDPISGLIAYTHDGTPTTIDNFTYTVEDNDGAVSNIATVTININEALIPNVAPVAQDDFVDAINEGQSIIIEVLANDIDSDGTLALDSVIIDVLPTNGAVGVDSETGEITYTNNGSLTTSDSFTYTVEDNEGEVSNIATVNITINEVIIPNVAPIAVDDIANSIGSGQSIMIDVLANDSDSDGSLVLESIMIIEQPVNGAVEIDPDTGHITYTHDSSSTTSDSFTYTVEDNEGEVSNVATVSISITNEGVASCGMGIELDGSNDWVNIPNLTLTNDFTVESWVKLAPGIDNRDALFGQEGAGPDLNFYQGKPRLYAYGNRVIAQTTLVANTWYHIAITRSGSNLTLYINGAEDATGRWNGKLNLKAIGRGNRGYFGGMLDEFRVWNIARSETEINANFDSDVALNSMGLVGYWSFNDSDQAVVDSSDFANDGSLGIDTAIGTDDPMYLNVAAPFSENCDGDGEGSNEAPLAINDSASVQRGDSVEINVLTNDNDSDGNVDSFTVSITSVPSEGTVTLSDAGTIIYTNNAESTATSDTLSYTVDDNDGATSNVATVAITISEQVPQNQAPVANDDMASVQQGGMVTIDVLGNDTDSDGSLDSSTVFITSEPSEGIATFNNDGTITYTNNDDSLATTDTLSYTVNDNNGEVSNTATVTFDITSTVASCGTSLEFDGTNDWVNIPDLGLDDDFTIEGWFKLTPGFDYRDALFGQEGYGPDIHFSAGRVRLYAYGIRVTAQTPLIANTWGHIAITRSGSNLTVYINGVKDATGRWNGKLSIKAIGRGNRGFFEGMMDEIRIWDVARSDAEINAHFDTGVAPDATGLLGNWRFNGSDQTVIDSSVAANHGSLGLNATTGADEPMYKSSTAPLSEYCAGENESS